MNLNRPCNEWVGGRNAWGYGLKRVGDKTYRVHRLEWEKHNGPIPKGLLICHHCDNPPCFEISHLFLGTQSDNMLDAFDKGRRDQRGESNTQSVLTEDNVRMIRRVVSYREMAQREIAQHFGVSQQCISDITNGRRWRHVSNT